MTTSTEARKRLNISIDSQDGAALLRLQKQTGCSKTFLIIAGLRLVAKELEDERDTFITKGQPSPAA